MTGPDNMPMINFQISKSAISESFAPSDRIHFKVWVVQRPRWLRRQKREWLGTIIAIHLNSLLVGFRTDHVESSLNYFDTELIIHRVLEKPRLY